MRAARQERVKQISRPTVSGPPAPGAPLPRWRVPLAALLLAAAVVLLYVPSLRNDFLGWDDGDYVRNNYHVQHLSWETVEWAFAARHAANWHPLTWLSHALDVRLYGRDDPRGHHLTSVLLHALNAALLLVLLWRLTRRFWPSLVVAAFFALHPLRVEVVSWIAERKELLCAAFFLAALLAYTWYAARPSIRRYLLVCLAFALALASKPMAVTLPLVLLLLDWWPLGRLIPARRDGQGKPGAASAAKRGFSWLAILDKLPLLGLSAASCAVTLWAQTSAKMKLEHLALGDRIANAAASYAVYLGKLLWPAPGTLLPFYTLYRDLPGGLPPWLLAVSCLVLAGLSTLSVWQWRRRPYLLVGWLWYLGTMVPVIGLVQVGSQRMADRYTYVPLVGLVLAAVLLLDDLSRRAGARRALLCGAATVAAVFAFLTYQQQQVWANTETLWQTVIRGEPQSSLARSRQGNDRGLRYADAGQYDKAIAEFRAVLAADPHEREALNNIGIALTLSGRPAEALPYLTAAVRQAPDDASAHVNLGFALSHLPGRQDDAVREFSTAVAQDPYHASAYKGWAMLEMSRRRFAAAIPVWEKLLAMLPAEAGERIDLARCLDHVGRRQEAIAQLEEALSRQPGLAAAHQELARIYKDLGRLDEAARHQQAAEKARSSRGKAGQGAPQSSDPAPLSP